MAHTFYCLFLAELGQTFSFYPTRLPGETSPGFINDYIPLVLSHPWRKRLGCSPNTGPEGLRCVSSTYTKWSGEKRIVPSSNHVPLISSKSACILSSELTETPPSPSQPKSHSVRLLLRVFCRQINAFINMPFHSSRDFFFFSKLISHAIILLLYGGSRNLTK